jgi:hypothetical protein
MRAIGYTIQEAIARADTICCSVTAEQKRDLFCRNAARFLRLEPAICEQRPRQKR